MKFIATISDTLYKVERILAVVLMSVMLGSIALGVLFRYFLGSPLTWTDELAVYMLIWLTFIGGSMSIKSGRAASLDLLFEKVSLLWKRIFLVIGYIFVIIFSAVVAYMAIKWISNPSIATKISPGLKISMFLPYLSIPFGLICLTVHAFNHFIQAFTYKDNEITTEGGH